MSELSIMLAAFGASFLFTALKAFQQLNVVRENFKLIIPTSVAMAGCQVFVIANIAQQGWGWIVLPIGVGAGIGAVMAMFFHPKIECWLKASK